MIRDEKVKPLDKLIGEKVNEFESGEEKDKDKDLDNMIWELGDYESQEAPQAAEEFKEGPPIEEELAEKELRFVPKEKGYLKEPLYVEEEVAGAGKVAEAKTIGPAGEAEECEIVCAEPSSKPSPKRKSKKKK